MIPYVILFKILSNLAIKKRDVCVQTDFEQIQTTKDVETITDDFAYGDTGKVAFETPNSPQPGLGDCEQIHFQHPTNPFLDNPEDLLAETESSTSFFTGITSHQVPVL
ncbi:hypothetical protein AVEN_236866-1, partial [Araneus ventricosus]